MIRRSGAVTATGLPWLAFTLLFIAPATADDKDKWKEMDYGPFLTASVKASPPRGNNANKGIAIRLGKDNKAAVCFDTDLLRISAGWTGDFLRLKGTPYDGSHGSWPEVAGTLMFTTNPGPGWARGDDFQDTRSEPFGPLPADRAKYKGLYLSGDQVVLKYTVGATEILELPGAEEKDGVTAITRTFNIGASTEPLTLLVCDLKGTSGGAADAPELNTVDVPTDGSSVVTVTGAGGNQITCGLIDAPARSSWHAASQGSRVELKLPASAKPTMFRLVMAKFPDANSTKMRDFLAKPEAGMDLAPLTKGGKPRWTQKIETKGSLGTGDGPYVVDTITVPEENPYNAWMRFGGLDFFSDGRAALSTWSGDVWVVSGIDDKLEKIEWKRFATGLFQPLGLKIIDDKIFVHGREGITRLHDLNGDGEADFYEAFNYDVATTTGFHEFAFDLQTDPEGNFYFSKAGPVKAGGRGFDRIAANSGTVMKLTKDGSKLENFATGFRAPNGIAVGPHGEVTSGDNEGSWMPKCRLNWIKPGGFYGVVDLAHRAEKPYDYDKPICWFPKDVDNSSGGQVWVTSDKWGPFKDRLLHMSYGTSSLFLVMKEEVDGQIQGGVTKFPVEFLTGVMRARFHDKDGQLYITGLRGWQTNASKDGAFQRVRYTGKPANMPTGLHVTKTGVEITFTDPLDPETAGDADSYDVEQWNYLWCSEYGSDDYSSDVEDFDGKVRELNRLREDRAGNREAIGTLMKALKKGHETVEIKKASLSPDGKTVTLEIPGMKPVMQMSIKGKIKSADGQSLPLTIHNTINKL